MAGICNSLIELIISTINKQIHKRPLLAVSIQSGND